MAVFATLTPANPAAKLAFDTLVTQGLDQATNWLLSASHYEVSETQTYDLDVAKLFEPPEVTSDSSSSESDEHIEQKRRVQGTIWTGHFVFDLNVLDGEEASSWFVGTGSNRTIGEIQFRLPLPNKINILPKLRSKDTQFFLDSKTGFLSIVRATTKSAGVSVDGQSVYWQARSMNNSNITRITIGPFQFDFAYTDYARTKGFMVIRNDFVKRHSEQVSETLHWTPTPAANTLTINSYTMHKQIASGITGTVYSATNKYAAVFAIKVVKQTPKTQKMIQREVTTLREIRNHFQGLAGYDRLLHLCEMIPADAGQDVSSPGPMGSVYFVSTPLLPGTLADVITSSKSRREKLRLFHEAVQGLALMHSQGYCHRDVKPENIGCTSKNAVILDLGTAMKLPPSGKILATPGLVGTIPYLAPEMEWTASYDTGVDVWALGIVGYRLFKMNGLHPWFFKTNPWNTVSGNDEDRTIFHSYYQVACDELARAGQNTIEGLLLKMLRFGWAKVNKGERISLVDALRHPGWQELA